MLGARRATAKCRGLRDDRWCEIPFIMSSRSDSARSCLTICAFSHFAGFWGLTVRVFTVIANTARKIATPTNTIVIIEAAR